LQLDEELQKFTLCNVWGGDSTDLPVGWRIILSHDADLEGTGAENGFNLLWLGYSGAPMWAVQWWPFVQSTFVVHEGGV